MSSADFRGGVCDELEMVCSWDWSYRCCGRLADWEIAFVEPMRLVRALGMICTGEYVMWDWKYMVFGSIH